MKLAIALLSASFAAPASAQVTLEVTTTEVSKTTTTTDHGDLMRAFLPLAGGAIDIEAPMHRYDLGVVGATCVGVSESGTTTHTVSMDLSLLDPVGTSAFGSFDFGSAACGAGDCSWSGAWGDDFINGFRPFQTGISDELPAGRQTYSTVVSAYDFAGSWGPNDFAWPGPALTQVHFQHSASSPSIEFGDTMGNNVLAITHESTWTTEATATRTMIFELDPASTTRECAQPAGQGGLPGELSVMGSIQAGYDLCLVQAFRMNGNQPGLLLVGTNGQPSPIGNGFSLCIGGNSDRVGGVQFSNAMGESAHRLDLTNALPGQTLHVQLLQRDQLFGVIASESRSFVVTN